MNIYGTLANFIYKSKGDLRKIKSNNFKNHWQVYELWSYLAVKVEVVAYGMELPWMSEAEDAIVRRWRLGISITTILLSYFHRY